MKLLLDHHYSTAIAEQLRTHGHDAQTALERGWQTESDESLLRLCASEKRALLTNNVADFTTIARSWAAAGSQHYGLIFTSDRSLPRSREMIGAFVMHLEAIIQANPAESALMGQICWLPPPAND